MFSEVSISAFLEKIKGFPMIRLGRIRKRLDRILKPTGAKPVILMYHRVADLAIDSYSIVVSPDHFAQQMEYLKRSFRIMRLLDLAEAIKENRVPSQSVAITFDDGYSDFFTGAYPVLKLYQIPATMFVVPGFIYYKRCFWWDELANILLLPSHLPSKLRVSIKDKFYEWPILDLEGRKSCLRAIRLLLKPAENTEKDKVLTDIASWAGKKDAEVETYPLMTSRDLKLLAQDKLLEFGAHTMTHPMLSALSPEAQYDEIVGSRQKLEESLCRPIRSFAYPFGERQDFNAQTVGIVKNAGFASACTAISGSTRFRYDLFRLPRYGVGNWDLKTFEKNLFDYFDR